MAFSKITKIILWVVAGISLLVVLFFYVGPKTVKMDDMERREQAAMNPVDLVAMAPVQEADSTVQDSTAAAEMVEAPAETSASITEPAAAVNLKEIFNTYEYLVWIRLDIALIWAYVMVVLALIAAIVFPLIRVLTNPKALLQMAIILAVTAIMVVVSYFVLASEAALEIVGYDGPSNSDPTTLKMIDTVMFITYMLFGLALASILYAIISKAFK